jgi:predicted metalloendopeptidase
MSREDLQHETPAFNWDKYLAALGAPEFQTVNVTEPKFYEELNRQLGNQKLAAWRASALALGALACAVSFVELRPGEFRFL